MKKLNRECEIVNFSMSVEKFIRDRDLNFIEGFVVYCDEHDLDVEAAAKLVSSNLKAKIEIDAIGLNLIKKKYAKLPL